MIRGIYSAVSGMNLQMAVVDTASGNLNNANLPGYKKDWVEAKPFLELVQLSSRQRDALTDALTGLSMHKPLGITNQGAQIERVFTDFAPGDPRETGKKTDFALQGPGFFTLVNPANDDEVFYTRNGSFSLDQAGYLVNDNGFRVMGQNGPVQVTDVNSLMVDEYGNVMENDDTTGVLNIVTFDNLLELVGVGNNLYQAPEQEARVVENPGLRQGFLEAANVDAVKEITDIIAATRAYETGQRIIQAQDGFLDTAINKVGVLR
ncbi:flagellar hook-basal body protein [Desulfallas thermosapovorans]|uniref:Flagellar basal-body rod protein FlgG n=1 Tax=Desulfallas thermosapovorans DSM 6562 TaxID=1121431 RepID=A0A5S4ZUB6_9FIRM|nr:flagellar hook-basal body protein [Desulfallas thermosapovorans]TYO96290.1 flagellar basal-body rod protein FlgG [Desulfallas thermosapovorans DSM 6562]